MSANPWRLTHRKPLARYGAVEGALRERLASTRGQTKKETEIRFGNITT